MARLTAKQRRAAANQLKLRIELEKVLERDMRRIFRKYISSVYEYARHTGMFYFPSELSNEIREGLLKHYRRCARKFAFFSRSINSEKWSKVPIDTKAWNPRREVKATNYYANRIDTRIRTRLLEIFDEVSTEKASSMAETTSKELNDFIEKVDVTARSKGIILTRNELAKEVRDYYLKRSDARSRSTGITETTYAVETTKEVEIEEVIDELDDVELEELVSTNSAAAELLDDLEGVLAELSGTDGITEDDVLAAGGLAAIAAGLVLTKTWVATLDDATREAHAEADGQEVPLTEPFNVGGEDLLYPGDPSGSPENVINCRCSVIYSV